MLRLALIAMASVVVVAAPSSAGVLSDDILASSNFERVTGSTPSGALTVSGPAGKKYVVFDLDSNAVFPHHALGLNGPAAHVHLGPGFPSGIGGTLHSGHGWLAGDGDVATGWKLGHDSSGGNGGGNGSGGGSGTSSPSAGGDGGGAGGSGGRKSGNTGSFTSSAFSGDAVTTDSDGWLVAAAQVPEPATLGLLGAAFGVLTATARRRRGQCS